MEGAKILFRVAVFLVQIARKEITNAKDVMELTQVFKNINKDHQVLECHTFMKVRIKISGNC